MRASGLLGPACGTRSKKISALNGLNRFGLGRFGKHAPLPPSISAPPWPGSGCVVAAPKFTFLWPSYGVFSWNRDGPPTASISDGRTRRPPVKPKRALGWVDGEKRRGRSWPSKLTTTPRKEPKGEGSLTWNFAPSPSLLSRRTAKH